MLGQFVVGVCVSEYRNGVLLSTTKRDFQFNIIDCDNIFATIPAQQQFCNGYTYSFSNTNTKAVKYFWNFGDPKSTSDTAITSNPTYTYSDSGTYTVMHVAWNNQGCADTAYTTVSIYPKFDPTIKSIDGQCITGNNFDFFADGLFETYAQFNWNFGLDATPQTSSNQNPQNVSYSSVGKHSISLTITENGCSKTIVDTAEVYPLPVADFSSIPQTGCEPFSVQFTDSSISGTTLSYLWNFGDGFTSTEANPIHIYTQAGIYDVSLTISSTNGCINTSTFFQSSLIAVLESPIAGIATDTLEKSIFDPSFDFTDLSSGATSCSIEMGDGSNESDCGNFSYQFADTGNYQITQIVYNAIGCTDTAVLTIRVNPEYRFFIPNTFTPSGDHLNETFIPITMGVNVQDYSFEIFNRWGQLVFETHDSTLGWNGRLNNTGALSPDDVYIYRIRLGNVFKKTFQFNGIVTLLK